MLRFRSLASGSSGNATLIEASDGLQATRILVDCGPGLRQLTRMLASAGLEPDDLTAVFITHEHGDHIGCALALAQRHRIPVWMSAGTASTLALSENQDVQVHRARDGDRVAIGALQIRPFTVPHDAREPLQLSCTDGDRVLGILTDLGQATPHVLASLAACHALLLEANHDPALLTASSYPESLKQRIAGNLGHLSNAQAAEILAQLHHPRLNVVVAAHLSEQNNRPQLARKALAEALSCKSDDVLATGRAGLDWIRV